MDHLSLLGIDSKVVPLAIWLFLFRKSAYSSFLSLLILNKIYDRFKKLRFPGAKSAFIYPGNCILILVV